jgi:signal peptidase I
MEIKEAKSSVVKSTVVLSKIYGNSMFPTLKSGDELIVKRVLPQQIKLYNIIIFEKGKNSVCHRAVNKDGQKKIFYTKGDFNLLGREKIKEQDIVGVAVAVISKKKFYSLKWQHTFLYYWGVQLIALLKEMITFYIDKLYNFSLLRKLLRKLSFSYVRCFSAKDEKDIESFYNLYSFLPQQLSSFFISARILGFYKGKFVGKLWVLKDNNNVNFWLWGPYVKLLYRARGMGTNLVKEALEIIGQKNAQNPIYALVPPKEALLNFYKKLGFAQESQACRTAFVVLRKH